LPVEVDQFFHTRAQSAAAFLRVLCELCGFKSDDINIENKILSDCRIETIIIFRVVKIYKYMTLNRITIDPEVMSGQPCIRGLRIPVPFILRLLASGKTNSQILKDYPELEEEDIRQTLSFASWATTEKTIPVTA
jgi:uncharacterized protein (DUF433 family)